MTDQTDDRLAEARREHAALQHATALLLDDKRLEVDVYRRVADAGSAAWYGLYIRSGTLIVENLTSEERAELADILQARTARLVARFGDHLDAGDGPRFDDAELDAALRRFLDDAGGAT